jgi:undecaprenyl diphosphate synthase
MGKVIIPEGLKHVAIIMDGNGRWAKKRLMPRTFGHSAGSETFVKIVDTCNESGLEYLTVYALSTENWNRSSDEIGGLMKIIHAYIA